MTNLQRFQNLPVDHFAVGLGQQATAAVYYCTPREAAILGWAGVDGIHYCTIPEFGEMIFAVSPMNLGDCVHPIARNFEDLMRLLLYCADMAALEQCYAWDEEQFRAFLADFPATSAQQAVLAAIRAEFGLEPMPDAFGYVKRLQREFDLSRIPYTEDYYDPDMNPAAPASSKPWVVTYDGGFWPNGGSAGEEILLDKTFFWGQERWYVPAAYVCREGLVVDLCVEVDPQRVRDWIRKWEPELTEREERPNPQLRQIEQENPLHIGFRPALTVNGVKLQPEQGSGLCWLAEACFDGENRNCPEAAAAVAHYGLDASRCWVLRRQSFAWTEDAQPLTAVKLQLQRGWTELPGPRFGTPGQQTALSFVHPVTGATHTLTVLALEDREMDISRMQGAAMEYPTHYQLLTYSLQPPLPPQSFLLRDCAESDAPRLRKPDFGNAVQIGQEAACIGIIGGADGPTAVFVSHKSPPMGHGACSSVHFAPVREVTWQLIFREKLLPDMGTVLL